MTAKKCTKKHDARAKLLFCSLNLLLFCYSRCRRLAVVVVKAPRGISVGVVLFCGGGGGRQSFVASPPIKCPSHNNRASYVGYCRREISFHFQYTFTLVLHSFTRLLFRVRFLCRVFFLLFCEIPKLTAF